MSGSRKSRKNAALTFNPRAENSWSKDESKFGQRMLERMGWKKGEGLGRDNQGISENLKIRWKLDSKGLGYKIKEDDWVVVEQGFSELLSQLSQANGKRMITKPSLESTSVSSRSRVHYRKFIRGKDISRYSKKDLSGILGQVKTSDEQDQEDTKECVPEIDENSILENYNDCEDDLPILSEKKLNCGDHEFNSSIVDAAEGEINNFLDSKSKRERKKLNTGSDSNATIHAEEVKKKCYDSELKTECIPLKKNRKNVASAANSDLNLISWNEDMVNEELVKLQPTVEDSHLLNKVKKNKVVVSSPKLTVCVKNIVNKTSEKSKRTVDVHHLQNKSKKEGSINQSTSASFSSDNIVIERFVDAEPTIENSHLKNKSKKRKSAVESNLHSTVCNEDIGEKLGKLAASFEDSAVANKRKKSKSTVELNSDSVLTIEKAVDKKSVKIEPHVENPLAEKKRKKQKLIVELNSISTSGDSDPSNDKLVNLNVPVENFQVKKKRKIKSTVELNCDTFYCVEDGSIINEKLIKMESGVEEPVFVNKRKKRKSNLELNCDSNVRAEHTAHGEFVNLETESNSHSTDCMERLEPNSCSVSECNLENVSYNKRGKREKFVLSVDTSETVGVVDDGMAGIKLHSKKKSLSSRKKKTKVETVDQNDDDEEVEKQQESKPADLNSNPTELQTSKICLKLRSRDDDFSNFMQRVKEFNASTNADDVIKAFEENKEKLLAKFRQNYTRKYLDSVNENDSRIYCELNGDELDCQNNVDANIPTDGHTNKRGRPVRLRPLSKAERIVEKARLLKQIQENPCTHRFLGSNVNDIVGYGNQTVNS